MSYICMHKITPTIYENERHDQHYNQQRELQVILFPASNPPYVGMMGLFELVNLKTKQEPNLF